MKTYYVLWTYLGNYSKLIEIVAKDAVEAADKATGFFSKDFHEKATVYVFDKPPVMMVLPK